VEVTASLRGLKEMNPGRLITVFQPHLFTRTRDFYKEFADALAISDEVILMDIYPAREKAIEGITSELILNEALKRKGNMKLIHERNDILSWLLHDMKAGDKIVFQGAGDVTNLCSDFVNILQSNNNN
ncbi:MAG TPA: cyanophycin synthetase, partial [Ignavibacteria bacterium]|nr:cyanophycin synthetase [Ignavibacteria bacterium]